MSFSIGNKARLPRYWLELVIFLAGTILVLSGLLFGEKLPAVAIGIGCSLVAGAVVSFLVSLFYVRAMKAVEIFNFWGLKDIFRTRQVMNQRTYITFEPMREHLDVIAWGLNSFRSSEQAEKVEEKIIKGLQARILAPDPDSPLTAQQDLDEGKPEGYTAGTIHKLKAWVDDLNNRIKPKDPKGSIELRFYNFRPQDFYWRQDSHIYVGPYLYGMDSQQTISFEYESPSRGFDLYKKHFEKVWEAAGEISGQKA